jgi:hypothetical protein
MTFHYTIIQLNFSYLYFRKIVKPFGQNPFKIRLIMKQFFDMSVIYLSGDWAMEMNMGHGNEYTCTEQHMTTQKIWT